MIRIFYKEKGKTGDLCFNNGVEDEKANVYNGEFGRRRCREGYDRVA